MSEAALTVERKSTLEAVAQRLLPSGEGPGAAETRAADAFERALQHRAYHGFRPHIERMLDGLQAQALERHGGSFESCPPAAQDELLRQLEENPDPRVRFVFRTLIELTLEGFLCDPVQGGNRDFLGWEYLGLNREDVQQGFCLGER